MTTSKSANTWVDYQARAKEFSVGDAVFHLLGGSPWNSGTVVAVWPAIGMVDVQWANGSQRCPVEDLQIKDPKSMDVKPPEPEHSIVPGGIGTTTPVDSGPEEKKASLKGLYIKLTNAWLKDDFETLKKMGAINEEMFIKASGWKTKNAGWIRKTTPGLEEVAKRIAKLQERLLRDIKS